MNADRQKSVRFESLKVSLDTYNRLEDIFKRNGIIIQSSQSFSCNVSGTPDWFVEKQIFILISGHQIGICSLYDISNNQIVIDIHERNSSPEILQMAKEKLEPLLSNAK